MCRIDDTPYYLVKSMMTGHLSVVIFVQKGKNVTEKAYSKAKTSNTFSRFEKRRFDSLVSALEQLSTSEMDRKLQGLEENRTVFLFWKMFPDFFRYRMSQAVPCSR